MKPNVFIKVREHGKLIRTYETHNVLVPRGHQWLANLIGYNSLSPDLPERDDRIRYLGVGIGGSKQNRTGIADVAPMSVQYPAGEDPLSTSGNEYTEEFPYIWDGSTHNPISTLERPVKITGGTDPYSTAPGTDRWLVDDPDFFNTHQDSTSITFHATVGADTGTVFDAANRPTVPLSEAGLFTTELGVDPTDGTTPFKPLVAYVTFDTILITSTTTVEFIWSLRF